MSKSILKNLSYNVLLQVVLMVLPLVSIPYVSRVLGAEGIGTYSFTLSITQYFIILGTLGIALYGNRQIAYVRDNVHEMSRTFWSISASLSGFSFNHFLAFSRPCPIVSPSYL